MDITVYLPDDIGTWAKGSGLNLSGMLRAELEAEKNRQEARAEIDAEGFERIEAYDQKDEHEVAFQGKQVGGDMDRGMIAYLTPKGAIVVVGEGRASYNDVLAIYDSYDEFARPLTEIGGATLMGGSFTWPYAMVTQVADALGEEAPIEELDI